MPTILVGLTIGNLLVVRETSYQVLYQAKTNCTIHFIEIFIVLFNSNLHRQPRAFVEWTDEKRVV